MPNLPPPLIDEIVSMTLTSTMVSEAQGDPLLISSRAKKLLVAKACLYLIKDNIFLYLTCNNSSLHVLYIGSGGPDFLFLEHLRYNSRS